MNGGASQSDRILIDVYLNDYATLEHYWNNPEFRAQVEVAREAGQREINRSIDDAMERAGTRWPAHWTEKEKYEASMHWSGGDQ